MISRHALAAGITVSAALFLGACTASDDTSTTETTAAEATADATTAASAETTTAAEATPDHRDGDDPVFAAIDAVLAERPGAVVVGIDRDDRESYDVDVVQDGQVVELEVGPDGAVREDEREGDDDDVRDAQAATVTAVDAIRQALEQHPDGVLDEIDLDEDDGTLRWEIELDDADRNDLVELDLPAT